MPENSSESVVLEKLALAMRELRLAANLAAALEPAWSGDEILPFLEPVVLSLSSGGDVPASAKARTVVHGGWGTQHPHL